MTRATCATCKHVADASKWQSRCTLHSPPFTYKDDRIVRADNSCPAHSYAAAMAPKLGRAA